MKRERPRPFTPLGHTVLVTTLRHPTNDRRNADLEWWLGPEVWGYAPCLVNGIARRPGGEYAIWWHEPTTAPRLVRVIHVTLPRSFLVYPVTSDVLSIRKPIDLRFPPKPPTKRLLDLTPGG